MTTLTIQIQIEDSKRYKTCINESYVTREIIGLLNQLNKLHSRRYSVTTENGSQLSIAPSTTKTQIAFRKQILKK